MFHIHMKYASIDITLLEHNDCDSERINRIIVAGGHLNPTDTLQSATWVWFRQVQLLHFSSTNHSRPAKPATRFDQASHYDPLEITQLFGYGLTEPMS